MYVDGPAVGRQSFATTPRRAAEQVLARLWDRSLPVDVRSIAGKLGLQIEQTVGSDVSGAFEDGDPPRVLVEMTEPPVRQRFTLAHEIGHFVMNHGPAFRDPVANFSAQQHDPREVDANRFAAELLMPREALDFYTTQQGITDLSVLARKFAVSELAMKFRLTNLGWL